MSGRDATEAHRASSPLELLFDLTFVVAVALLVGEFAAAIADGDGLASIPAFLSVFFAIWWAWMNFTWFSSAYDTDDVFFRLLTVVQMGGVLVLAAGVPRAFDEGDFLVVTIGYVIMRLGLVAQWVRAAIEHPERRAHRDSGSRSACSSCNSAGWPGSGCPRSGRRRPSWCSSCSSSPCRSGRRARA